MQSEVRKVPADSIDGAGSELLAAGAWTREQTEAIPWTAPPGDRAWHAVWPYVQIARVDHWFKNVFVLMGVVLAFFYRPEAFGMQALPTLGLALLAVCLVASSNYVINELLDAPFDRHHPTKRLRPAAAGRIDGSTAILEWTGLAALGFLIASRLGQPLFLSIVALWVMGCVYNIAPVRSKDQPYLDVLSESVNNPLRLLIGWFAFVPDMLPPVSLVVAYWMIGAFFMATKRYAEYRRIGDPERAARYRASFRHYNETRLLVSMMFYATSSALFTGIFIVRYKLELVLWAPLAAGFMAYYFLLGLRDDSPTQTPEKLYKERGLVLHAFAAAGMFALLMFVEIEPLYHFFRVEPASTVSLWRFGM